MDECVCILIHRLICIYMYIWLQYIEGWETNEWMLPHTFALFVATPSRHKPPCKLYNIYINTVLNIYMYICAEWWRAPWVLFFTLQSVNLIQLSFNSGTHRHHNRLSIILRFIIVDPIQQYTFCYYYYIVVTVVDVVYSSMTTHGTMLPY